MDAKLTLKFDKEIIEAAKEVASERGQSLSRIVENYLRILTKEKLEPTIVSESDVDDIRISPFVKALSKGTPLPNDLDENEYFEFLIEKHSK